MKEEFHRFERRLQDHVNQVARKRVVLRYVGVVEYTRLGAAHVHAVIGGRGLSKGRKGRMERWWRKMTGGWSKIGKSNMRAFPYLVKNLYENDSRDAQIFFDTVSTTSIPRNQRKLCGCKSQKREHYD